MNGNSSPQKSGITLKSSNTVIGLSILVIFIIGSLGILGLWANYHSLSNFGQEGNEMKLITAICFILTATALTAIQITTKRGRNSIIAGSLGFLIFAVGLVMATIYLFELITGERFLFEEDIFLKPFLHPDNRMAFMTSIIFTLTGCIFILLSTGKPGAASVSHILLIPAAIGSYLIPVSYILGVHNIYIIQESPSSLNSGIAFCAVCVAVFLMRPGTWLMGVFQGDFSGSNMARRLLPGLFVIPLVIGWLRLLGERHGLFNSEIGVVLVVLTYTVCFFAFIWFTARAVNRADQKRWKYQGDLKVSERNLQAILDATKESVFMFDLNGTIIAANVTAAERLGHSLPEIINHHFAEFMSEPLAKSRWENFSSVISSGEPLQFQDERDGRVFLHNFYPVFEKGMVNRLVTYSQDITERHKMEKELNAREVKFRNVFENSNDAIMITDIETRRYIDCNKMTETLTGYTRSEMLSMKAGSLLKDSHRPKGESYINILKTGKVLRTETEILRRDGKSIPVEFNASVLTLDNKPCIVSLMRDISERKKSEEQLKRYASDLKSLVVTKDKFFGIIAHDLKNPFSSLLSASELLSKYASDKNPEKIKYYNDIVISSARSGYELLENLLEWSRTQTGIMEFIPEWLNLKDIAERNLLSIKPFATNKNVMLVSEIKENIPIQADRNMLDTILRNLLNNAIKFSHQHGQVTLKAIKNENELLISVQDTGIGIDRENVDKLFKIDTKFVNIGTANERGTGLGLLLCKEFIEKHGGRIWVESVLGQGSEFTFTIPNVERSSFSQSVATNGASISVRHAQDPGKPNDREDLDGHEESL